MIILSEKMFFYEMVTAYSFRRKWFNDGEPSISRISLIPHNLIKYRFIVFSKRIRDTVTNPLFSNVLVISKDTAKKMSPLLFDFLVSEKEYQELFEKLVLLTDGERVFSLKDALNENPRPILMTSIELSKYFAEKHGLYHAIFGSNITKTQISVYKSLDSKLVEFDAYNSKMNDKDIGKLFREIFRRRYGEIPTIEKLRTENEEFATRMLREFGYVKCGVPKMSLEEVFLYESNAPNPLFPTMILNPENPEHRQYLDFVELFMEHPNETLLLYSEDFEKLEEEDFKQIARALREKIEKIPVELRMKLLMSII